MAGRLKGVAGVALLVAFAIADIVLIAYAVRSPDTPEPVLTVDSRPTSTPTAREDPSKTPPVGPAAVRQERPFDALNALIGIRGRAGDCAAGDVGDLELTTDGGASWVKLDSPVDEVLRVKLTDANIAWVVGAGGDCVPLFYRTSDRGGSWQGPNGTLGAWHRFPGDGFRSVHGPSKIQEQVDNPCSRRAPLVELDGVNDFDGAVLCADGSVHLSSDAGLTWAQAGPPVEGAIALSFVSGTTGFLAVAGDDDCAGLAVLRTDDAGDTWDLAGCASGADARGLVGLAFGTDQGGMLVVDRTTYGTTNGGQTWTRTAG